MMAAAATMTYLNYELINLVKGGLAKERGLREEGKTADNKWPWLGEQIDKMLGIYVAPAETPATAETHQLPDRVLKPRRLRQRR